MNLTLKQNTSAVSHIPTKWNDEGQAIEFIDGPKVMLWKFIDENGNLWNTETAIDGTEEEAASIILGANQ